MVRGKPWGAGHIPLYGTPPVTSGWEEWVEDTTLGEPGGTLDRPAPGPRPVQALWPEAAITLVLRALPTPRGKNVRADDLGVRRWMLEGVGKVFEELSGIQSSAVSSADHVPKSKAGSPGLSFLFTEKGIT